MVPHFPDWSPLVLEWLQGVMSKYFQQGFRHLTTYASNVSCGTSHYNQEEVITLNVTMHACSQLLRLLANPQLKKEDRQLKGFGLLFYMYLTIFGPNLVVKICSHLIHFSEFVEVYIGTLRFRFYYFQSNQLI